MKSTRKEARLAGDRYYYTGKPCKHGHDSKRTVATGNCYECQQLASNKCYHDAKKDIEKRKKQILTNVRQRANRDNVPFDLEVEDLVWNKTCPIFGYEISYDKADRDRSPSLDKTIPSLGYVKGNVVVMSNRANRAKWDMSPSEIGELYEYICTIGMPS